MCNNLVCISTSAVNARYFHFPYEKIFSLAIATLPLLQQVHGLLGLKSNTLRICNLRHRLHFERRTTDLCSSLLIYALISLSLEIICKQTIR